MKKIIFSHHLCFIEYYLTKENSFAEIYGNSLNIYLKGWQLLSWTFFLISSNFLKLFRKAVFLPHSLISSFRRQRGLFSVYFLLSMCFQILFRLYRFSVVFTSKNTPNWVCGHFLWWFLFELLLSLFPLFTLKYWIFFTPARYFSFLYFLGKTLCRTELIKVLSRLRGNAWVGGERQKLQAKTTTLWDCPKFLFSLIQHLTHVLLLYLLCNIFPNYFSLSWP